MTQPTDDQIAQAIHHLQGGQDDFVILSDPDSDFYIQCAGDARLGLQMEYHIGTHWFAALSHHGANKVIECFIDCNAGRTEWTRMIQWERTMQSHIVKPPPLADPVDAPPEPWVTLKRGHIQFTRRTMRLLMRLAGIVRLIVGVYGIAHAKRYFPTAIGVGTLLLWLSFPGKSEKRGYND